MRPYDMTSHAAMRLKDMLLRGLEPAGMRVYGARGMRVADAQEAQQTWPLAMHICAHSAQL